MNKEYKTEPMPDLTFGTYRGAPDFQTDDIYRNSLELAIKNGIKRIDTAINYRNQRSEKVIGDLLKSNEDLRLIISTKGGFISDCDESSQEIKLIHSLKRPNIIADGNHCIETEFIFYQLNKSIENLGLKSIDIYYLHNPEAQLLINNHETLIEKIYSVFELFENSVSQGLIKSYGIASYYGFRASRDDRCYLSLSELNNLAIKVGGKRNHFKWIMVPYNLYMTEIETSDNQTHKGSKCSLLSAAHRLGKKIVVVSPFFHNNFPKTTRQLLNNYDLTEKNITRKVLYKYALTITSQLPYINSICIGMINETHILQNIRLLKSLTKSKHNKKFSKTKVSNVQV